MNISFIFSIASLILWAFTFIYLRSLIINRTKKERILSEFRDEIDRLIADIDTATDRDIALIEDRIKTLKALLDDTDKRILAYKKEINRRATEEQAYAELGRRQARSVIKSELPQEGHLFEQEHAQRPPETLPEPKEADQPIPKPRFVRSEAELKPKAPSFSEQVLELYEAGFSPELIASKLKVTVAEVDLAINVSGKNRKTYGV